MRPTLTALIAATLVAGCKEQAPAVEAPAAENATPPAASPAPAKAPDAAATEPAQRPPHAPAASVLKPGATLVYEWAAYVADSDDPPTIDARFVTCTIGATVAGISVSCPPDANNATLIATPWWGPGTSCYAWRPDGLWRVACAADEKLDPSLHIATAPGPDVVAKDVRAGGERLQANCYEPAYVEEPGDDSGQHHCASVTHGPVWVASWYIGSMREEGRVRLLAVLPPGQTFGEGPLAQATRTALDAWAKAQNDGDFGAYIAHYAPRDFEGIKRAKFGATKTYDHAGWRRDRKAMFRGPLTVSAAEPKVFSVGDRATVLFTQDWASRTYRDRGPKSLDLEQGPTGLRISREDMIFAFPVK